jgi:hypothetical protein
MEAPLLLCEEKKDSFLFWDYRLDTIRKLGFR